MQNKDYFIVENRSPNSPQIEAFFIKQRLKGYIQFEENIADCAVKIFLRDFQQTLRQYPYISFTDADLFIRDAPNTFQEIWEILQHPEVGVCTVDLDMSNFPHKIAKPSDWIPAPIKIMPDYIWGDSGAHLMTLQNKDLDILFNAPKAIDGAFRMACASKRLRWVKTKRNKAYHLTWDYYSPGNPYYEFRKKNPMIFQQDRNCNYKIIV